MTWSPSLTPFIRDDTKDFSIPDGITVTGPVRLVPPKNSLLSDWMQAGAASATAGITVLNIVSMPMGTIIDVHISYTIAAQMPPLEVTTLGSTLGNVYYMPFDVMSKCLNTALPSLAY
jgi:NADH:ubiquinone oxidoreductase subunit 6 (subunit J)